MTNQEELRSAANDLWYTLHEDYFSTKPLFRDFTKYIEAEIRLLQDMTDEKRQDLSLTIENNGENGRNITFAIMTAITGCRESFPDELQGELNTLLAAVVNAFSTPNYAGFWTDLYEAVAVFKKQL